MTAISLIPPDGTDWSIDTRATADGVVLAIAFRLDGELVTANFGLDRLGARELADNLRRDAGDGTMRTFPHPAIEDA